MLDLIGTVTADLVLVQWVKLFRHADQLFQHSVLGVPDVLLVLLNAHMLGGVIYPTLFFLAQSADFDEWG